MPGTRIRATGCPPQEPVLIRTAKAEELTVVLDIERRAFGGPDEANLVEALLVDESAAPVLSLLAFVDGAAVGHILFTKIMMVGEPHVPASLLAPLAILPEFQKRGLGGALVEAGVDRLGKSGVELVFVLGYPDYYTRFGFHPAYPLGLIPPYEIDEKNRPAWMVRSLRPQSLNGLSGRWECASALAKEMYWRE